jgi:hypothetical protein
MVTILLYNKCYTQFAVSYLQIINIVLYKLQPAALEQVTVAQQTSLEEVFVWVPQLSSPTTLHQNNRRYTGIGSFYQFSKQT